MALHILVSRPHMVSCLLLFIYMRIPPNHSCLEFSGRVTYMETPPLVPLRPMDGKEPTASYS